MLLGFLGLTLLLGFLGLTLLLRFLGLTLLLRFLGLALLLGFLLLSNLLVTASRCLRTGGSCDHHRSSHRDTLRSECNFTHWPQPDRYGSHHRSQF